MNKHKPKVGQLLKKFQVPAAIIIGIIAVIDGATNIYDKINSFVKTSEIDIQYNSDNNYELKKKQTRIIIPLGETMDIFENDIFQITVDKIINAENNSAFQLHGKLDNGFSTQIITGVTQGSSLQFNDYIIQTTKITSDYVEFRITQVSN